MKVLRTNFDRHELRRDRRYLSPTLIVTILRNNYATHNWSLGGFRPIRAPDIALGRQVAGLVRVASRTYRFTAQAVHRDATNNSIGFRFIGRSPELVEALDRAVIARVIGGR